MHELIARRFDLPNFSGGAIRLFVVFGLLYAIVNLGSDTLFDGIVSYFDVCTRIAMRQPIDPCCDYLIHTSALTLPVYEFCRQTCARAPGLRQRRWPFS